ncbi:MAG: dehydrogenase, partial [Bacteroidetes bacterium]
HDNWQNPAGFDIVWRARNAEALPYLAKIIADPNHNPDQYLKFFRAFDFHPESAKETTLMEIMNGNHPQQARINSLVLMLLDPAKIKMTPALKLAIDKSLNSVRGKQDYLDLLARFHLKDHNDELLEMAQNSPQPEIRSGAARMLLNAGGEAAIWTTIRKKDSASLQMIRALGGWEEKKNKDILQQIVLDNSYPAWMRIPAAEGLARGWSGEDRMLALAKSKQLPEDVKTIAVSTLSHAYRPEIREEAAKYLNTGSTAQTAALPSIEELVSLKGDATAGSQVFNTYCTTCHQVNGKGVNFGPALSEIGSKLSKEAIYNSIIHPSAGISFGFDGFIFKLKNGSSLVGYVASETSTEISIKQIGGNIEKHLKSEIASQKPYGSSLMPEGLAQTMGKDQLVNLVEYLQTLKKK